MKRVLIGIILSIVFSLMFSCSEKEAVAVKEVDEVQTKMIDEVIMDHGVSNLYAKYLPDLKPCLVLINQYNEQSIYHDEELGLLWILSPLVIGSENLELTMNGKTVDPINHGMGEILASVENGRVIVKKFTNEQLLERHSEKNKGSSNHHATCIGHGLKFDVSDVVKIEGTAQNRNATQHFTIDYNPNEGWRYQCDAPIMQGKEWQADVFGFSKKSMLEQFKEAFKNKKECILRFNYPSVHSNLIKFNLVEYVVEDDLSDDDDIEVGANFIRVGGKEFTDLTKTKLGLRGMLENLCNVQINNRINNKEYESYTIGLHQNCSDEYLRALLGELDRSEMNYFNLRFLAKKP